MEKLIFKKPPAQEVKAAVTFDECFDVADSRNKFYNVVKAEFPTVSIPEQKLLSYNYGDYSLAVPDNSYRLEVGLNYFRLVANNYAGFSAFGKMFVSALGLFRRTYDLENCRSLTLQYSNVLPVPSGQGFGDVFSFTIHLPAPLSQPLFTSSGILAFQDSGGFVSVQVEPNFSGAEVNEYRLNLFFYVQQQLKIPAIDDMLAIANQTLYRYFVNLLQKSYVEFLLSR